MSRRDDLTEPGSGGAAPLEETLDVADRRALLPLGLHEVEQDGVGSLDDHLGRLALAPTNLVGHGIGPELAARLDELPSRRRDLESVES